MRAIVKNELVITREEREVISNLINILEVSFGLEISENAPEITEILSSIDTQSSHAYISEYGNDFPDIDIKYIDY